MRLALAGRILFWGVGRVVGVYGRLGLLFGTGWGWGCLPNLQFLFQNGVAAMGVWSSLPGQ